MALRYLTVNYRIANPSLSETLESLLRGCIEAEHIPGIRFSQAPADRVMIHAQGGKELLLNEFADVTDGIAGIICEVIPGLLQPVLKRQAEQRQLTTNTVSTVFQIADQAAGDQGDFVQGLCYFYVRQNHVIFITVKGFRKKNRLVADVQWSVAGPRNEEVKSAIQDIVTELANMDDGIVGISGKDGEIKDGSVILEVSRPFEVALDNTILIDFDHATDVLVSTLARWVEDQKLALE